MRRQHRWHPPAGGQLDPAGQGEQRIRVDHHRAAVPSRQPARQIARLVGPAQPGPQHHGVGAHCQLQPFRQRPHHQFRRRGERLRHGQPDEPCAGAHRGVFELILPAELEEKLLDEVADEAEQEIDPETGELREPEEPELDPEILAPYEDQIRTRDVTPGDFGRIAAQTANR